MPTAAATLAFQTNPVITVSPVVFQVPGRQVELHVKVTAPLAGNDLSILILSHGHGRSNFLSSMRGYAPLVNYYAAKGFVVIQPTHQNSRALAVQVTGSERELFWKSRTDDVKFIIDRLDAILSAVPGLSGRADQRKLAMIGHSMGGHTTTMMAGMSVKDLDGTVVRIEEPRIRAFVILAAPGQGDLASFALEHYPIFAGSDFSTMTRDALVVNGDKDKNPRFSDRDQWRADPFHKSPGPKSLLTIYNAEHMFGGISGYDVAETTDDDPERVLFLADATLAYLRSALNPQDTSWQQLQETLRKDPQAKGSIERK